jgi:hypothetical protein
VPAVPYLLSVLTGDFLFAQQLDRAYDQIIVPLEHFRKEHIGGVKVSLHLLPSNYF